MESPPNKKSGEKIAEFKSPHPHPKIRHTYLHSLRKATTQRWDPNSGLPVQCKKIAFRKKKSPGRFEGLELFRR